MTMVPLKSSLGRPLLDCLPASALLLIDPPPPPVQAARVTTAMPSVDRPTTERRNFAARVPGNLLGLFHMGHSPFTEGLCADELVWRGESHLHGAAGHARDEVAEEDNEQQDQRYGHDRV